ncbi:MAG: hypothetical protein Q7U91_02730 [Sideroxyarcus sp.]|nr:hypothetical protein [Sideroxyarcus sp.]
MSHLDKSLHAWGGPDFEAVLKAEVAQLGADQLPLQQGLSVSSYVADSPVTLVVHGATETDSSLHIRAGIFYQGIVAGCSCADDPTPTGENTEYCEVQIDIDKASAAASVTLLAD